jgi:hypothetical protein
MSYMLYIDPGSGSYLVQVIIGAVLGIAFFFRSIWAYIKSIFIKPEKKKDDNIAH